MADQQTIDPTEALRKAISTDEPLNKAKGGEGGDGGEGDDQDDYKPENMKKHMKRFMKEEKSYMKECLKNFEEAKDLTKSLVADFGAVNKDQLENSDMIMLDGTAILEKSVKATEQLSKATENLMDGVSANFGQLKETRELLQKACSVIVDLSDKVKALSNEPLLAKSQTSIPGTAQLQNQGGANEPLAKAKEIGYAKMKDKLFKSAVADPNLNSLVGMLDGCKGFFERIEPKALATMVAIASKEG